MKIRHLMMFPFKAPLNSGISTDHISSAQELLEDTSPVGTSKELSRGTGEFLDLGNPRTFRGRLWENHQTTKWTMAMSNYQRVIALYYIHKMEDCEQNNYCWNTLEFRADCPETFCSSLEFQVCCVMLCVSAICGQYHCWWFRTPCGSLHFRVHASLVQGGNIPQNLLEPKVIWVRVCPLVHCIWTINTVTGAKLPAKLNGLCDWVWQICNQENRQRKGEVAGKLWQMEFKLGPRVHGLQVAISAVCMKVGQWVPPYPLKIPLNVPWVHLCFRPAITPPHRLGREWSQQYLAADMKTHQTAQVVQDSTRWFGIASG